MYQQYLPAFTKIVAVNGKKVPPSPGRCYFLPTPPRLRAVRLAGFAVPVPCRAAASVGFVVRLSGINPGREPDLPAVQMVRAKLLTSPPVHRCPEN